MEVFNKRVICLFTLLFLCQSSFCIKEIYELTDSNYEQNINHTSIDKEKWIIVFYLPTCPHCKVALTAIENIYKLSELNDDLDSNVQLKIGRVDCNANTSVCVSYGIKSVPHIVKLENHRLIKFKKIPSEIEIKSFIAAEHEESETEPIPEILNYFYFMFRIFHEGLHLINDLINEKLKSYGFEFKWSIQLSLITLSIFMILLIAVEIMVIMCCCNTKQKDIVQTEQPKKAKITENEDEKKEEEERGEGKKDPEQELTPQEKKDQ